VEQYRNEYLFHAPVSFSSNYVNVVGPTTGGEITIDGSPIGALEPIGSTGFGVARVLLPPNDKGNYTITGSVSFGITVYGYNGYGSYWYPGGLDLQSIVVE